jgi:hypothetical protein
MTSQATQPTLVLQPGCTFAQMAAALERAGWTRGHDTLAAPPIIPGEPELASWSARGDGAQISYTFNPVVHLRVLVFYGARAGEQCGEVEGILPTLGLQDLRDLLQSTDARQPLLGIFAARELKAFLVLDLLEALRDHPQATVARAAQKAHAELLQVALEVGGERLREEKERHPERSVLFPRLGDAHMRRQTLRWLIRDYRETNEHITAVLRSGLMDEDWEVRATAMLAAARLGARELVQDIRRLELPKTSRNGPDETDRTILFAARKIVLEVLAQDPVASIDQATVEERHRKPQDAVREHLRRCILGLAVTQHDRVFHLIQALTEPLEVEDPSQD